VVCKKRIKRIRKNFGNKNISIYDAGSGYGQYSYFMSKNLQPCEIYSVDVKEEWIKDSIRNF
jgi:tRNA1(Val) A37 N6-methylase TrmN6